MTPQYSARLLAVLRRQHAIHRDGADASPVSLTLRTLYAVPGSVAVYGLRPAVEHGRKVGGE